jgi:1,4-dihydroxy-6-naphthoate synthase
MFYGLARKLLDTGPYHFEHVLEDIQTLNQRARKGELEITAISIHAYPHVADKYALTSCGGSVGERYGPLVIAAKPCTVSELKNKTIAIPGELTTAFLALQLCLGKAGEAFKPIVVHFDQIPKFVKDGNADAGLIIHEGQLTYQNLGLHPVVDLGIWWHEQTGLPLPLGGNCIRRDLGKQVMQEVTNLLKRSIQFSLDHRAEAVEYALQFGRDLDRKLADRFVGMYVNDWTLDYGPRGRQAISTLLDRGAKAGLVPAISHIEFITAA